ncbi:MAG: SIS domain-containing protein [Armatimonadetes bacterium]|nr:SIS domain-containing protein [Armatimonadota bacterium]
MHAAAYFDAVEQGLRRLRETQLPVLQEAARLLADTIERGGTIFAFGATHSFAIAAELVYRTGGLMLINPIYPHGMDLSVRPMTMTSQLERLPDLGRVLLENSPAQRGDALIIASTSGRNAVAIDMALAAKERDVKTIAVTSVEYSNAVASRHPSGKRLMEVCDIVLDNCAPAGDAAVAIAGLAEKTGPLSTVLGCAVVNALVAETIGLLIARGIEPPVFLSANLDGGDEHNARLLSQYRDRIHYL